MQRDNSALDYVLVEKKGKQVCPRCKNPYANFVNGDYICGSCGMVLASRMIDYRSEWRTFSGGEGADKSRVGGSDNSLLDMGLSTLVTSNTQARGLAGWHQKMTESSRDAKVKEGFKQLGAYADLFGMQQNVKQRAQEIFVMFEDNRPKSQPYDKKALTLAVLYLAAREEGVGRVIKEIAKRTGTKEKQIQTYYKKLQGLRKGKRTRVFAHVLVNRICSVLNLEYKLVNQAVRVAKEAEELREGRGPASLAAASVLLVCKCAGVLVSEKDVADAASTGLPTLRTVFKELQEAGISVHKEVAVKKEVKQEPAVKQEVKFEPVVKVEDVKLEPVKLERY